MIEPSVIYSGVRKANGGVNKASMVLNTDDQ